METLDSLEGTTATAAATTAANNSSSLSNSRKISSTSSLSDASTDPMLLSAPATAMERAKDLFHALDRDDDKLLTKEEFVRGE